MRSMSRCRSQQCAWLANIIDYPHMESQGQLQYLCESEAAVQGWLIACLRIDAAGYEWLT